MAMEQNPDITLEWGVPTMYTESVFGPHGNPSVDLQRALLTFARDVTGIQWNQQDILGFLAPININCNVFFFAEGSCDNLAAVKIFRKPKTDDTSPAVTGTFKLGFKVQNTTFGGSADVKLFIYDGSYGFKECTAEEDEEGACKTRSFVFDWRMTVNIDLAVVGSTREFAARQAWQLVQTRCCEGEDAEELREEMGSAKEE